MTPLYFWTENGIKKEYKKIEDKIKEVKGLKDVTSVSQINMSIIRARIDIDRKK